MAIYSLHHSSIGKTTQEQAHTAAAHVRYIMRESALSHAETGRVPGGAENAETFMTRYEDKLRKNGRVADKLMLALPRELSAAQRQELVRSFAETVTDGRAIWIAAIHDKGKDQQNPHCHLMICDRDATTGRRVFHTSEKGSTERLRVLWEDHANGALHKARRPERIDRRSLEARGVKRAPTIHVGVRARQLVRVGRRPNSESRLLKNSVQARTSYRTIDYKNIDQGKSRFEFNVQVRRDGLRRSTAAREERDYWASIDQDALIRDMKELKRLNAVLSFSLDGQHTLRSRDESVALDRDRDI